MSAVGKVFLFGFGGAALLIIVAAAVGGSEKSEATRETEAAVKALLRDPSSAEFRSMEMRATDGKWQRGQPFVVCGEVNSRNGFGGMVGYARFVYVSTPAGKIATIDDGRSPEFSVTWSRACL